MLLSLVILCNFSLYISCRSYGDEIKIGYLNISDLTAEFHAEYLNDDKNLINLDILVIADSRLNADYETGALQVKLDNYILFARYDSEDASKHMGMVALCSRNSTLSENLLEIQSNIFQEKEQLKNGTMETYMQGMIVTLKQFNIKFAFIYIRRKECVKDAVLSLVI